MAHPATAIKKEIVELHQFFENWFNAEIDQEKEHIARLADVLSSNFMIIPPSGVRINRDELLQDVWNAYGSDGQLEIDIKKFTFRGENNGLYIGVFEEWHTYPDKVPKGRLSTAIFSTDESAPNKVIWNHVHEVWIE